jgi:hypothetical protein
MQNDFHGALRAWNRIGKPRLDSVRIDGLAHMRYSLLARALGLTANGLLTDRQLTFAERRLQQLPDRVSARIAYRPESDGFATVDVVVVERAPRPRGPIEWAGAGAQTLVDREVRTAIPGRTGQGEVWTASWRWWTDRPLVAIGFSAPRVGALPGVWRVEGSWEVQTYGIGTSVAPLREERGHGSLTVGDWFTPNLRYEMRVGLDSWTGTNRAGSVGAEVEQRFLSDRMSVAAAGTHWTALSAGSSFRAASLRATFRSSTDAAGFVTRMDAGLDHASVDAPLALWPGAGEGRARGALLRAHPLLHGGIIDGPVFGRSVAHVSLEGQRWLARPSLIRAGIAVFADLAGASHRLRSAEGPLQLDAGVGLRLRLPGRDKTLRVDYGRGIANGANALTVGWQFY